MKELLWRCIGQCSPKTIVILKDYYSQKILVLQSHDEIDTIVIDTHTPLNEKQWEETLKEKRVKDDWVMF